MKIISLNNIIWHKKRNLGKNIAYLMLLKIRQIYGPDHKRIEFDKNAEQSRTNCAIERIFLQKSTNFDSKSKVKVDGKKMPWVYI